MNDTTRWIMIILLLLLIAAAVFMLLRSPGKDNGDGDGDAAVDGRDTDRDGVPDGREGRVEPAGAGADRGVYDQEADARASEARDTPGAGLPDEAVAAEDDRSAMPATERMDEYAHPDAVDDRDRERELHRDEAASHDTTTAPVEDAPVDTAAHGDTADTTAPIADESEEPYRPEAGAVEDDRARRSVDDESGPAREGSAEPMTDVHPLTDSEIDQGGSVEPLTREEQEPGVSPEGLATGDEDSPRADEDSRADEDRRPDGAGEGPDMAAAAAAGAAGAAGAAASAPTEEPQSEPTYEQGTLYDDAASHAGTADRSVETPDQSVESDDRGSVDESQEYPVGDETTTYRAQDGGAVVVDDTGSDASGGATAAPAGWDSPPADGGSGAPQTADEIVESPQGSATPDTGTDEAGADTTGQAGYAPVYTEAAYGPGSADPLEDGTGPAGWEIKGNIGSMLFHTPESPSYDAVRAEVWFESEEAARSAGFAHWDRRRR